MVDTVATGGEAVEMPKPIRKTIRVSQQLRDAVRESGEPMHVLARAAGLHKSAMSRFMSGERGLRLETVDALCERLGLRLVAKRAGKKATP